MGHTNHMNANYCFIVQLDFEVAKFKSSADKAPIQRCLYYVCQPPSDTVFGGAKVTLKIYRIVILSKKHHKSSLPKLGYQHIWQGYGGNANYADRRTSIAMANGLNQQSYNTTNIHHAFHLSIRHSCRLLSRS